MGYVSDGRGGYRWRGPASGQGRAGKVTIDSLRALTPEQRIRALEGWDEQVSTEIRLSSPRTFTVYGSLDGAPPAAAAARSSSRRSSARSSRAALTPSRHEPALTELVDELALPLLRSAITGTAEQVRLAAGLVRTHIEAHGPDAARELRATAQRVKDPALVVNLARAGSALERCPGETLARIRVDATRSAGQAPSRRPRRRR